MPLVSVRLSMLRYVVLALLADGRPKHGYALMKAYAERSGVRLSVGNVYRELQRLVADGLIVTAINPEGADARRAPYAITQAGREALAAWLGAPAYTLVRTPPDPLSYRLALLTDQDAEQAKAFLDDLHDELWVQSKAVERERAAARRRDKDRDRSLPMRSILLGRRARHLAADIELVDEMRSLLAARLVRELSAAVVARESPPGRRVRQKVRDGGKGAK